MAEGGSEEKRHAPTERRLRQAAEKGNIKRSQDFPKAAVTTAMIIAVMTAAGGLCANLSADSSAWLTLAGIAPLPAADGWLHAMMGLIGPVVLFLAAISLFASFFSGGWVFSVNQLLPDFSKLMPTQGLGQVFSMNGMVETGKSLLKVVVIGGDGRDHDHPA